MMPTEADWSTSNPGPNKLFVWLEPWADEFEVPIRSTIALKASGRTDEMGFGDIEWSNDGIVIWAAAEKIAVFIDGQMQESTSAIVPIPEGLTKDMLTVLFADQPSARLGGAPSQAAVNVSWWERVWRRIRSN